MRNYKWEVFVKYSKKDQYLTFASDHDKPQKHTRNLLLIFLPNKEGFCMKQSTNNSSQSSDLHRPSIKVNYSLHPLKIVPNPYLLFGLSQNFCPY